MSDTSRNGRTRRPSVRNAPGAPLVEGFAPKGEVDVAERHRVEIDAPADLVFEVAESFDLLSIRTVYAIFWLRARILGAPAPGRADLEGLVPATKAMGWGELARRPGRELVMGAAVQPWLPEPVFKAIPPDRFREYYEPNHVKIVWTLEAEPLGPSRTLFTTRTRVRATDDAAGKKFRRYWRLAGKGIVLIRLLLLPAIRNEAEARAGQRSPPRSRVT